MPDFMKLTEVTEALRARIQTTPHVPAGTYRKPYDGPCREDCPICSGSGLMRLDVPKTDPRFGKLEPCPNIPIQNRNTRWRHGLTLNEQDSLTWSAFEPLAITIKIGDRKQENTTTDKLALRLRDYLARQGWGWVWLTSVDKYGLAKSMLIKAAIAEALRAGTPAAYIRASELVDDLRLAFDEKNASENAVERINNWVNIPVLAIDEFEKINPTDWTMERLLQIMDRRYELAKDHSSITLIASNKAPEAIDGSLGSRAKDGRFLYIELSGKDARPLMTTKDIF